MVSKLLVCFWVGPKFGTHAIKVTTDHMVITKGRAKP